VTSAALSAEFRVLLVEDSSQDARLIEHVLRRYSLAAFSIEVAVSTQECVERMRSAPPDVILLDHGLPGENGLSFLQRLARMPNIPPVIMLTGYGDESMAVESIRQGAYDYFPKDALASDILGRAVHLTLERFKLDCEVRRGNEQVIFALADAVESKDSVTGGHLQRMAGYSQLLGEYIGLDEHELMVLRFGAILHDIGKISISESVLCKAAPLTEAEWVEMKKHPVAGERICAPLRFSDEIGRLIRHHHERWDGKGYVDGLAGEDIPVLARLISVVDAFDAMTNDRPYRKALPFVEATANLSAGSGTQFDPEIVDVFLRMLAENVDPAFAGPFSGTQALSAA
jgi:putative two-component system response regulator